MDSPALRFRQQETYLMASIANDKAIIKELEEGSGDIHSLVAYMSYPNIIPRDTPIGDIKKLYHQARQNAKGIEFAVNLLFNVKLNNFAALFGNLEDESLSELLEPVGESAAKY